MSCYKCLYLFACALGLIYGQVADYYHSFLPHHRTCTGERGINRTGLITYSDAAVTCRYHYCYPVITALRVWA